MKKISEKSDLKDLLCCTVRQLITSSLHIFFERTESIILSARRKSWFHSSDHLQILAHFFFISTSTEKVTEEVIFCSFLMVSEIMKHPIICVGIHKNRRFGQSKKTVKNKNFHFDSWFWILCRWHQLRELL